MLPRPHGRLGHVPGPQSAARSPLSGARVPARGLRTADCGLRFPLHSYDEWNIREAADVQLRDVGENSLSLLQGTVSLLILRALQKGPAHGYSITRWIHERTDGAFVMEDAALYQALHRLEAREWIEAEWGVSENNRRAKYYSLTTAGRRQLRSEVSLWKQYAAAMLKVIDETG